MKIKIKAWNEAKHILYGNRNQFTDRNIENQKMKIGSKNVANSMNCYNISKIKKIKENMQVPKDDPMKSFKKYINSPDEKLEIKENLLKTKKIKHSVFG